MTFLEKKELFQQNKVLVVQDRRPQSQLMYLKKVHQKNLRYKLFGQNVLLKMFFLIL
jgi:hypothetical protein